MVGLRDRHYFDSTQCLPLAAGQRCMAVSVGKSAILISSCTASLIQTPQPSLLGTHSRGSPSLWNAPRSSKSTRALSRALTCACHAFPLVLPCTFADLAFTINFSGPVISPAAKSRIEGLIASVDEEGGKILLDGRGYQVPGYPDGNWVGPTVVEATTTMRAYRYVYTNTTSQSSLMLTI